MIGNGLDAVYKISEAGRREKGTAEIHSGAKVREIELGVFDQ